MNGLDLTTKCNPCLMKDLVWRSTAQNLSGSIVELFCNPVQKTMGDSHQFFPMWDRRLSLVESGIQVPRN